MPENIKDLFHDLHPTCKKLCLMDDMVMAAARGNSSIFKHFLSHSFRDLKYLIRKVKWSNFLQRIRISTTFLSVCVCWLAKVSIFHQSHLSFFSFQHSELLSEGQKFIDRWGIHKPIGFLLTYLFISMIYECPQKWEIRRSASCFLQKVTLGAPKICCSFKNLSA